jgi:hypothetical protein
MLTLRTLFCFLLLASASAGTILGQSVNAGWISLQEGQSLDGYTKKDNRIYCGEVTCDAKPMVGVDVASFKVWPGSKYAKDKALIYYPLTIACSDYVACGVCACTKYVIGNLSVKDFEYLGKDYATDRVKVYFRGQELERADGKSFKIINGPDFFYFAVDKSNVYKHNEVFLGADPSTFYYDHLDKRNEEGANRYVIADKKHKWLFMPPDKIKTLK